MDSPDGLSGSCEKKKKVTEGKTSPETSLFRPVPGRSPPRHAQHGHFPPRRKAPSPRAPESPSLPPDTATPPRVPAHPRPPRLCLQKPAVPGEREPQKAARVRKGGARGRISPFLPMAAMLQGTASRHPTTTRRFPCRRRGRAMLTAAMPARGRPAPGRQKSRRRQLHPAQALT